jgi:hypothetical protein
MLSSGVGGLLITYSIRFFLKSDKSRQDLLRFLWVSAAAGLYWAVFMRLVPREVLMVPTVILLITIFDFALFCYRNPAYLEK